MSFQVMFFTMVASQAAGLVAAQQLLVDPSNTWISWPVLVAIMGLAIVSTRSVVRFVDSVNRRLSEIEKKLEKGGG